MNKRKLINEDGTFYGYASIFHARDDMGDIVMPGAFQRSLKRKSLAEIPMLYCHESGCVIGEWLDIHEDPRGLFVRGRIDRSTIHGEWAYQQISERRVDGLSIGFRAIKASRCRLRRARLLHKVELFEISITRDPVLRSARIFPQRLSIHIEESAVNC